jgi:hypothetical protein
MSTDGTLVEKQACMKRNITIGGNIILDEYLTELEIAPWVFHRVIVVSPFTELSDGSELSQRICQILKRVKQYGGKAFFISEFSVRRISDFRRTCKIHPELADNLLICKKLHAKCGYAHSRNGLSYAFMGSSNVTHNGMKHNREIVMLIRAKSNFDDWYVFSDIKSHVDEIYFDACISTHLSKKEQFRRAVA